MNRILFTICICFSFLPMLASHRQCDIYLVGSNTGWQFRDDHKMQYLGEGVYTLDCRALSFDSEFKIATSDWKTVDFGGATVLPDETVSLTRKGSNIAYPSNWKIASIRVSLTEDLTGCTLYCASMPLWSGTLPVIHINTVSGRDITSNETCVAATCWQESLGIEGQKDLGSSDAPLALKIRGRGNWTWNGFDKKPYRIKFEEKAPLAGLRKAKNFCLMARADDDLGMLRDEVGFEISRRLSLPWTPESQPVELVLNGKYYGLYFVTEPIRIGEHHVDITEQADLETHADSITGGWLMEIDNYAAANQIQMKEGNGKQLYLTYHSPENLSSEQRSWLAAQMSLIDNLIYTSDKASTEWEEYIDKEALVRYYMVNEIMEDTESFHGSCFFYRDRGDDARWTWGPVWDFGNAFRVMKDRFIYDRPQFDQYWIGEMAEWESFQSHVRVVWQEFLAEGWPGLTEWVADRAALYAEAARYDAARWPSYGTSSLSSKVSAMQTNLEWRIRWLTQQWGEKTDSPAPAIEHTYAPVPAFDLLGRPVGGTSHAKGIILQSGKKRLVIRN